MCGLHTPIKKSDSTETYTIGTNVTVVVRVRPLSYRELDQREIRNCLHVTKNVVSVNNCIEFIFDHCIKPNQDNVYLYEQIGEPLLDHALDGYNVCMFAYGQTGSGKTHSIMGRDDDPGLMHQFVVNLFARVAYMTKNDYARVKVECSYYEIYNEKIHDLLSNDPKTPLRVREHPVNGPYIVDLSTIECTSYQDVSYWINMAQKRRLTACTNMNQKSSRSHTIFTLSITQDRDLNDEFKQSITSKVNIVDLAGSERTHVVNATGERLKESVLINKSLLTLGKVITQLAEYDFVRGTSNTYIPYRESVLTWLLKESLGGNSKTTMIATVSPANIHQEETLTTLRYAATARRVVNIVKINEDPKIRRIRELEHEVEVLKQRIAIMECNTSMSRGRSSSIVKQSSSTPINHNGTFERRRSNISHTSPIRVVYKDDLPTRVREIFADILKEDL
uniref:Kinesin-like protein n=1 Tax=Aceria tosichella TaxID=561515 RepID=A0A6G1SMN8_9ACAR